MTETFETEYYKTIIVNGILRDAAIKISKLKQLHEEDMKRQIKNLFSEMFVNINHISCGEERIHMSKQYYLSLKEKYIGLTAEEKKEFEDYNESNTTHIS
jgi:hypothetical protein